MDKIPIADGYSLRQITSQEREDFMRGNALREGDQSEVDAIISEGQDPYKDDSIIRYGLFDGETMFAFWSSSLFPKESVLSKIRIWEYLSSNHVNKMKKQYLKHSKTTMRKIWELEMPWVEDAFVYAIDSYDGCHKWLYKCFNVHFVHQAVCGNEMHTCYRINKGEQNV